MAGQKLRLAEALLFSTLFYNVHVWPSVSPAALKPLEITYNRVLRRIAGQMCGTNKHPWTDRQVREFLGVPSVECVLLKKRLRYLCRLVHDGPDELLALLQCTAKQQPMPWIGCDINLRHNLHVYWSLLEMQFQQLLTPLLWVLVGAP